MTFMFIIVIRPSPFPIQILLNVWKLLIQA